MTTTKQQLIDGFELIIREGLRTTGDFSPDDWNVAVHDDEGGWNRKQILCHVTATAEATPGLFGALVNGAEGQDAGAGFDIGAFNAQAVADREHLPAEELRAKFKSAFENLIEFTRNVPDEQLEQRRQFGDLEGNVGDMMSSLLVLHSLAHIYLSSIRAFV